MDSSRGAIRTHVAQLIQQWLRDGVTRKERLELAKCHLTECINQCEGDASALLRVRVRAATSLEQVQILRVGVFNLIAHHHHQQKAIEAIRLLESCWLRRKQAGPARPSTR